MPCVEARFPSTSVHHPTETLTFMILHVSDRAVIFARFASFWQEPFVLEVDSFYNLSAVEAVV